MQKWIATIVIVLGLPLLPTLPADAGGDGQRGSFVAQAFPFPVMDDDVYYPRKSSCLEGVDGIHKVAEPFRAPAAGSLVIHLEGLSGDWDLYALGSSGERLGASENAQVLDGSDGDERVTVPVKRRQQVQMVACNWLGEPEVTVYFDFTPKKAKGAVSGGGYLPGSPGEGAAKKGKTHRVEAAGGPITPLWAWDPSELEISVGDKVVWGNETSTTHHVTPYGGPWEGEGSMHLSVDGKVRFVFRKPGEYLYRCDFAFAGVEHSLLIGDECIGMCGRIVVEKRR